MKQTFSKKTAWIVGTVAVLCIVAAIFASAIAVIVPEGYIGVKSTLGRVDDEPLYPGWHWTAPWDSVVVVDTRWQKYEFKTSAFSKDIQQVDVQMSFSYSLDKQGVIKMYKNVGVDYDEKIINPLALDALKSTFAKYSAEQLVTNREQISGQVFSQIKDQLLLYDLTIREVAITDIDFTDSFTDAIEAKQVATQNKLKTETEQEQQTIIAKAEAERARIAAEASAEQVRIKAQADADAVKIAADAEAYRLEMEAKNITDKTIEKALAERWDGKLPAVTGGTTSILDVSELLGE